MALGTGQWGAITGMREPRRRQYIPDANMLAQLYAEQTRKTERGEDIALQEKGIVSGETTAQNQLAQQLALSEQDRQLTERLALEQMGQQRETAEEALSYQKQRDEEAGGIQVADLAIRAATSKPAWELAKWGFDYLFPKAVTPVTTPEIVPGLQSHGPLADELSSLGTGTSATAGTATALAGTPPGPITGLGTHGAMAEAGHITEGGVSQALGSAAPTVASGIGTGMSAGLTAAGEGFGGVAAAVPGAAQPLMGIPTGALSYLGPALAGLGMANNIYQSLASKRKMESYFKQPGMVSMGELRGALQAAPGLTSDAAVQAELDRLSLEQRGDYIEGMQFALGGGGYDTPLEAAKQWVPHYYDQGKYTYGAKPQPQPVTPKIPGLTGGLKAPIPGIGGYKSAL